MKRSGKKSDQDPFLQKYRINERIRVREVRVIGSDGAQLGVLPTDKALYAAKQLGLDLVEIAPQARPPVCKITDFGKMRYDFSKKQKQMRKNQNIQITKTVQVRPNIGESDLIRKIDHIQKFIDKGYRVVVQVTMKGRQRQHQQLAEDLTITKIKDTLVGGLMEQPQRQGGKITVTFSKDPKYAPPEPSSETPSVASELETGQQPHG